MRKYNATSLADIVASQQTLIAKVDALCHAVEQLVHLVESLNPPRHSSCTSEQT